jgi:hypothetical protein
MPLGYPLEIPKAPRRKELKDLVYFERYGQKVNALVKFCENVINSTPL